MLDEPLVHIADILGILRDIQAVKVIELLRVVDRLLQHVLALVHVRLGGLEIMNSDIDGGMPVIVVVVIGVQIPGDVVQEEIVAIEVREPLGQPLEVRCVGALSLPVDDIDVLARSEKMLEKSGLPS